MISDFSNWLTALFYVAIQVWNTFHISDAVMYRVPTWNKKLNFINFTELPQQKSQDLVTIILWYNTCYPNTNKTNRSYLLDVWNIIYVLICSDSEIMSVGCPHQIILNCSFFTILQKFQDLLRTPWSLSKISTIQVIINEQSNFRTHMNPECNSEADALPEGCLHADILAHWCQCLMPLSCSISVLLPLFCHGLRPSNSTPILFPGHSLIICFSLLWISYEIGDLNKTSNLIICL